MARNFFDSRSWFWKPFGWIGDVVMLSCLWFLCSVPVITIGAATTALYDCAARCIRGRDQKMFSRFFRTFKQEFGCSTLCLVFWGAVIGGCYALIRAYGNSVAVTKGSVVLTAALLLFLIVIVGIGAWVLPLLSRFTFTFGSLNLTASKLALVHLPRTMILGLITVVVVYLCVRFWIPFLFLPAVLALLWSVVLEPVFRTYMPEESAEN